MEGRYSAVAAFQEALHKKIQRKNKIIHELVTTNRKCSMICNN